MDINNEIEYVDGDSVLDVRLPVTEISPYSVAVRGGEKYVVIHKDDPSQNQVLPFAEFENYIYPVLLKRLEGRDLSKVWFVSFQHWVESDVQAHVYKLRRPIRQDELIEFLKLNYSFVNNEVANAYVRLFVIIKFLKIIQHKDDVYFDIDDFSRNENEKIEYFELITKELRAKSKRVELLIKHGGTKGSYRENLLIALLKKYLPSQFSVSTGFIYGKPYQVDILVYDSHNHTPFFNEANVVVVSAESVRAIIEVKSTITPNNLFDAINHLDRIDDNQTKLPIFKGVVGFARGNKCSTISIVNTIKKFYNQKSKSLKDVPEEILGDYFKVKNYLRNYRVDGLHKMITGVCILDDVYLELDFAINGNGYPQPAITVFENPKYFELTSAQFIFRMFSFLTSNPSSKSDYINSMEEYSFHLLHADYHNIYDEEWYPPKLLDYRRDSSTFFDVYCKFLRWKEGLISSDEMARLLDYTE